jgi:hypothetical protein
MPDPTPQDRLNQLMSGYWHTQAIYVAAKLRLADLLADGPRAVDELAAASTTQPRALYRLLRALASVGIFVEVPGGRFGLTPMAECLRTIPGSARSLAIMRGEWQYEAWGRLLDSVKTGRPAFELIHGERLFDHFVKNPERGKLFDDAMTGVHGRETSAMLAAYDFSGIRTLADIGGGNGDVLLSILKKYPALRGLYFDLPAVAERARANFEVAGVADRCQIVAGSFFETIPAGADAYMMRHIIHDWDDDQSATILRHCRTAMDSGGMLLVVEGIVPPENEPSVSKFFDLAMMVLPGGLERTEDEYRRLFAAAGFRLSRVTKTTTWVSVIEGMPTA